VDLSQLLIKPYSGFLIAAVPVGYHEETLPHGSR
jgi:hypothetical protein